jgi:RNA polymerase sigma factor for flagellar operon FliA
LKKPTEPLPWSDAVRGADSSERTRFLESHIDLVRYFALRVAARLPAAVELDDLVHDGIVGLLDATDKFDPDRGVRFRTYAEARVRGAILDGLRLRDWRSRSVRRGQRELEETIGRLATLHGRAASEEEICEAMGLDPPQYRRLLREVSSGSLLSLDDLPPKAHPVDRSEGLHPHASIEKRELLEAVAEEVLRLPERERRVMELYYTEALTMKEIGAVLGVTESRVCQLHAQAAARIRSAVGARLRPAVPVSAAGGKR